MIIGGDKKPVIENIKAALRDEDYSRKVELGDPKLSKQERTAVCFGFIKKRKAVRYKLANRAARTIENIVGWAINRDTEIVGIENIKSVKGGAIVTSNHFNPLDSTIIRKLATKTKRRRLFIVSQDTNFAASGFLGFLLYNADTIPITQDPHYQKNAFIPLLKRLFKRKQWVLIYPEQEMWFNYRKPRPPKRGAYYFAAKCGVPVISCFTEMTELDERDNEQFKKVRYILHVLPPIYPEKGLTVRENSLKMMERDYEQKERAYESAYGKPLSYEFSKKDIAGFVG